MQHLNINNNNLLRNSNTTTTVIPKSYNVNYDSDDSEDSDSLKSFKSAEENDDIIVVDNSGQVENHDLYKTRSGRVVKPPARLIES